MAHWEKYLITGQKEAPYNARWFISWQSSCLPGSFPQDPASVAADETKETGKFFPGSAQPFPTDIITKFLSIGKHNFLGFWGK